MGKQAAASTARWRLRVHAEGAQGIKAASGMMSMDAKPDPYVIFEFHGVTKKCEPVQDVEPLTYFAWPNAVVEFDVYEEAALLQAALTVHVKDSDVVKDRYIGGMVIPLAPLCAGKQGDPRVLCQSKFYTLEFEDEKFKKKKACGEVKLTMTVVDTMKTPAQDPKPVAEAQKTATPQTKDAKAEPTVAPPQQEKVATDSGPAEVKKPSPGSNEITSPANSEPANASLQAPLEVSTTVAAPGRATPEVPRQAIAEDLIPEAHDASRNKKDGLEKEAEISASAEKEIATTGTAKAALGTVRSLKIELVSARNLTRPTSLGALFDRKPDPVVTVELYGLSKTSVALKDVDLKKPVEWVDAFLVFELPHTQPMMTRKGCGPLDLVVHVKDENLMKATYMGGGKIDLSGFFEARSEEAGWCWRSPSTFFETAQERIITLMYSDEKLSKKKACGEITLRFHFEAEPLVLPSKVEPATVPQAGSIEIIEPSIPPDTASDHDQVKVQKESPVPVTLDVIPVPKPIPHGDVKMVSVELLSGRGLSKPKVGNLAKSMMKSMFDRKPDPYAVIILGSQTRKCPATNNVDVGFFEWKNAIQVFEFACKPYPEMLTIHVRDEDVAGSDPYMGGARIPMEDIWGEASTRAISDPPGDPQLVKSFPLTFADEKLTKQKDCGSVTIRFRWIYSDAQLPVIELPALSANPEELLQPVPPLKPRTGFVILKNMVLYNNTEILDSSLDLYVEASGPSIHECQSASKEPNPHTYTAKSSVLTDAMKKKDTSPTASVEWLGDELVVPICVPLDVENADFADIRIELKDKNAIMQDAKIAAQRLRLRGHAVDVASFQPFTVTIELEPCGNQRKPAKSTLKFKAELQFLPHDSPLLATSSREHQGGMVTLFLMRSVLSPSSTQAAKDRPFDKASLALEIECHATKKTGLMSFGKSPASDFYSPSLTASGLYEGGLSVVPWWSTCNFVVTNKQAVAAKEKETFSIEVGVRMRSGKTEKVIGSLQLNVYSAVFMPSAVIHTETIQFGGLGSMTLEFLAAFRTISDQSSTAAANKSSKPVAPPVPSGYLHLIILQAKNLVSPHAKDEKAEDLDPEVRVAIEPKYIKRKDNPVRSMLKTKPLENAGPTPTWNEYLRLEYLLPPSLPLPTQGTKDLGRAVEVDVSANFPPPVVQIGIFDIQMPGEKSGVQAIGKTELPLSAFLLGASAKGEGLLNPTIEPFRLSLDVFLAAKKTGILVIECIFEPAPSEFKAPADDPAEVYRQQCRSIGRDLRERSKRLKSGEVTMTAADLLSGSVRKRGIAGRLEIHVIGYRGGQSILSSDDRGLSAHLWISSGVDDRREMKSRLRASEELEGECQIVWDARFTFFTDDVSLEMLRSEVLTLTGKPVGSLKLPLGGLLGHGHVGRTQREWYPLTDQSPSASKEKSSKAKDHAQEVLLELTFFADQAVFDPLSVSADVAADSSAVIVIDCGKVIVLDAGTLGATEIACKCSLLGDTPSLTSSIKAQAPVERTSFKLCESAVGMDGKALTTSMWNEQVKLDVGGSAHAFITQSFAIGTQPAVRFELLTKRQSARFQDTWASQTLSLVTLLHFTGRKAVRWLKFFPDGDKDGKDVRLSALIQVEIAVFCSTAANFSALKEEKRLRQAFDDMAHLTAAPGVLCLRFLSGRNLLDVDANGEQDPYIIAKIIPRAYSSGVMQSACQTGVSLDGGRHPTWNTSIFELRTQDLLTDYIRVEVIDSNEEDHLPDAYIGAIDIALISLFRQQVTTGTNESTTAWQQPKTRWFEAWVPIYPVTPAVASGRDDGDKVGEIRVEFRFLTEEYYETSKRQQSDTTSASSPFSSTDSVVNPAKGTLCLHIVQAFGLSCSTGMQPGIRIVSDGINGAFVTKPGKKSIMDPVWDNEIVELPWPPASIKGANNDRGTKLIKVEVVDLAVRTANVNALAVIAYGQVDVSCFLAHELARSYHVYPLHGRKGPSKDETSPSILIGCQFVPEGQEKEASGAVQKHDKRQDMRSGSLHVKCTCVKLDVSSYLNTIPLGAALAIRLRCCASRGPSPLDEIQCVAIPIMPLAQLVERNGCIDIVGDTSALLFKYVREMMSSDAAFTPNPTIVGELVAQQKNEDASVIAEFEVPVFDYVLFDGHLGSSWYSLLLSDPLDSSSPTIGEVKVEVQFLPVLGDPADAVAHKLTASDERAGVSLLAITIKQLTGWSQSTCCVVAVELFGCRVETKPNLATPSQKTSAALCWNEVLDLVVPKEDAKTGMTSPILKLELRDAADSTIVLGSCNWVVPQALFATDGGLAADSDDIVVQIQLPVGIDKRSRAKSDLLIPELTFQLVRNSHTAASTTSGSERVVVRRSGLLYIQTTEDASLQNLRAVLVPSQDVESLSLSSVVASTELSSLERRVVAVHTGSAMDSQSLVIFAQEDDPKSGSVSAMAVLDGHALVSLLKAPAIETTHRLSMRKPNDSTAASTSRLGCTLMYLEAMQGQLQLQFDSVEWPSNKATNGMLPGTFRLELRLLSGLSQRWVSSPPGLWSRGTNKISWRSGKNELSLGYTNMDEQAEPTIQLVLVQDTGNDQAKKEAFGQISVLSTVASSDGAWRPGTTELSLIGTNQTVQLALQLRFVREECSFQELEANLTAERGKKALELAEGTAALKKAFAIMGGDERTAISIAAFMKHVKEAAAASDGDSDRNAIRAMEVLQHAADIETDGDLDGLFALMDVNGDGQISWDEYVDHMQNIHALADTAVTQSIQKQIDEARASSNDSTSGGPVQPEHNEEDEDRVGQQRSSQYEDDHDDGSDLDDDHIIDMPARSMRTDTDKPGIQDIYSLPLPTGEPTKEGGIASKRMSADGPRQSKHINDPSESGPAAGESKATAARAKRSSVQSTRSDPPPEIRVERREEQRREEPVATLKKKLPLLSTYVLDWKVDEVVQWMECEMELSQYTNAIQQNAVNGKLLLTLREEELESELGVTAVLHKRKIMNQIREFQERFQYPSVDAPPPVRTRPPPAKRVAPATVVTTSMVSETPSFIKREQLVFQEKQRAKQAEAEDSYRPRTLGQSRLFPTKTKLVTEETDVARSASPALAVATNSVGQINKTDTRESFDDAMQDIFEVIHPDSPEKQPFAPHTISTLPKPSASERVLPRLPLIQIGSVTNTDELFEIVRQRLHQLSQLLLPIANECKETWSDFGDDPDDDTGDQQEPPSEEQTGLHLVYDAFRNARRSASTERISRLKFQEGLADLMSIEVSWHQFDLLFRRLDVDGDSELCWDEFHHVFTRHHISFEREDLLILQEALVDFAMARLESQQWTLSDLFKAFDRDGGGTVSIAEFATLVRFLFTSSTQVKRFQQQTKHKITKRHVYLLMSCLDASADRRISHQEFLRFFFIVWSNKLMEVQDQLLALEASPFPQRDHDAELVSSLRQAKRTLRRALRTNFSRPFRDAMRCLDVSVPGPFSGILTRLQLTSSDSTASNLPSQEHQTNSTSEQDSSLQVWQVLRGETSQYRLRNVEAPSLSQLRAPRERAAREASRQRVQKGKNEVQRTRLTRQREPTRDAAVLQTPARHVALDREATLKLDFRPL